MKYLKRFSFLLLGVMALAGGALPAAAQSLTQLAPADSILTLGLEAHDIDAESLRADLAALDWDGARETFSRIAEVLDGPGADEDVAIFFDLLGFFFGQGLEGEIADELVFACPPLAPFLVEGEFTLLGDEALLTVGMSPFAPMPAVTALTRLEGDTAQSASQLQDAIVTCAEEAGEVLTMDQEGVPFYVLGDGSDLPLVVGNSNGVFFVSTNPDAARGVLRRLAGADEPSLAGRALMTRTRELFATGGISFSLDLDTLADVAEGLGGMMVSGPEEEYLFERSLALMRTLGGFAGKISPHEDGLLFESLFTINEEGGDAALAELLLCATCTPLEPTLAPSSSVSVASYHFRLAALVDYLQGWLDGAEAFMGMRMDLRELLLMELGFDLDTALLDWIGESFYLVTLEALSPNLGTLLYQPAQALVVPITSVEAAEAGREELAQLAPLLQMLLAEFPEPDFPGNLFQYVASESYDYEGITIDRYRFGFNSDIGIAFIDDQLAIGSPARALETLIDTAQGRLENISNSAGYQAALDAAPEGASSLLYRDDRLSFGGIAELAQLISQPLAFAMMAGIEDASRDPFDDFGTFFGYANLFDVEATPLVAPGTITGELVEDEDGFNYIANYYELTELVPGSEVTVNMYSEAFDTYLYLVDSDTEEYLDANDDYLGSMDESQITFTVQPGINYWVEVTSFSRWDTGEYTLTLTVEEGEMIEEPETVEPPSYTELLNLTDLLPSALAVIVDHLDYSEGYGEVREEGLYSRTLVRVRW